MHIPSSEIRFHPYSFRELGVRLFQWKGELYRGVSSERAPFFKELFEKGIIQNLAEKGLFIESELTSMAVDGYELVIRHRRLAFPSYPNEWCAAMLKDGALCIIDLASELARGGFTLRDANPWNLLFDIESGKPIFVDLGSIIPILDFTWHDPGFYQFCLYPLVLMAQGEEQIARLLMSEDAGVTESDILRLKGDAVLAGSKPQSSVVYRMESAVRQYIPLSYRTWLKRRLAAIQNLSGRESEDLKSCEDPFQNIRQRSHVDFLSEIRREIESLNLPSANPKHRGGVRTISNIPLPDRLQWTPKQVNVHKVFTELKPSSVLDVNSGTGWYSMLAALTGSRVVAWDTDPMSITQLYFDARKMNLPILPLIMDFTKPTPSRGWESHFAIAASDRFKCDMVVALGLVHHLVHNNRLNFEQIAVGLSALSERWALLEFVPSEDPEARRLNSTWISWYTLDNLLTAVKKHFSSIHTMESYPESRILLVCQKS
jgi:SAM-dependent methyltransferase